MNKTRKRKLTLKEELTGILGAEYVSDDPELLDVVYKCNTCGGGDASCKRNQDMEPLRVILDMRAMLVEEDQLLPQHMPLLDSLKREDNTMMSRPTGATGLRGWR